MFIIKYLKSILYIFISVLLFAILIGTLSYFNILGNSPIKIFELIAIIVSTFIGGLYLGKNSSKRGFLEGLKIGLFMVIFLFCLKFFGFNEMFSISNLIFYIIVIISPIIGSVIGINKKGSTA